MVIEERKSVYHKNKYVIHDDYAEIVLTDRYGVEKARATIDLDDIERCKGIRWFTSNQSDKLYVAYKVNDTQSFLHRFLIGQEGLTVDHIDRNRMNCRKSNLRNVSQMENMWNISTPSDNKSGTMGVCYQENRGLWRAYITRDKKRRDLGSFKTKQEAIEARLSAERGWSHEQ